MKAFFKELLEYNRQCNESLISVLTKNPGSDAEKSVELLSHIMNAHQIWNYRIEGGQNAYSSWETHELNELHQFNEKNFQDSITIVDRVELTQPIQYADSKGRIFNDRIYSLLFQIINHSTYHRGQIATEFRRIGLEPLLSDFIYYKMTGAI